MAWDRPKCNQVGDLVSRDDAVYEVIAEGDPPVLKAIAVLCASCSHPYYVATYDRPAERCPDKSHEVWRFVHLPEPAGTSASAATPTLCGQ